MELVKEAMERPSPAETTASAAPQHGVPAVSADSAPTPAPAAPAQKSIFDFSK
jgi:hypothetical protein